MFNKLMWKGLRGQSGMALPMALMLMVVASLIVVPGLWAVSSMARVNLELETSTVGYYAAKAGVEDAIWQFRTDSGFTLAEPYSLPDFENGMTVTVSRVSVGGTEPTLDYIVQSTAKLMEVEVANIFAKIRVVPDKPAVVGVWDDGMETDWIPEMIIPGTQGVDGYPFVYAVASTNGNIELNSTSKIISVPMDGSADIFANGNIMNDLTSGYVHGGAYATGIIDDCKNIQDGCNAGQAPVIFQPINMTWYWEEAKKGTAYTNPAVGWNAPAGWPNTAMPPPYIGTRTYEISGSNNVLGGANNITYIDGNLRVMASQTKVTVKGVVWVNGWIWSDGNCSFTTDPDIPGDQCYLIARSPKTNDGDGTYSIIIDSNSQMNATGNLNLIADNGGIWLKGNMRDDLGNNAKMGIVYAPDSKIFVEANTYAEFGSIIGKSVDLRSNIWIYYNTGLKDNPIDGFQLNVTATDPVVVPGHWADPTQIEDPHWDIEPEDPVAGSVGIMAYSGQ